MSAGPGAERRAGGRRGLRERLPALLVFAVAAAGMVQVLTQHWRQGAVLLGGSLLVAAVLRVVLPPERVGVLAIRGRTVDVLSYGGLGLVVAVLALTITRGSLQF